MKIMLRDGQEVDLEVDSFFEYPRGKDGLCAFCQADPCGETSDKTSPIWRHMHNPDGSWSGEPTCPVCDGRPT